MSVFLVETGFHHVGQAGLELLTLKYLPVSVSHSAKVTAPGQLYTYIEFLNGLGLALCFA